MDTLLRNRLSDLNQALYEQFLDFADRVTPILRTVEALFPEFTRHDPAHVMSLEVIAAEILHPVAFERMSAADLFVLLCALWAHDAGMGVVPIVEQRYRTSTLFQTKASRLARIGVSEQDAWREYVRDNHHTFCPMLVHELFGSRASQFLTDVIGRVAQSHGERSLGNRAEWPKLLSVDNQERVRPAFLAVILRLSDIMHFSHDRAPEYMIEHRNITNTLSLAHWRAHQVAAGYSIVDDVCYFDGITFDDEAYWFAQQFIDAMDKELAYCKREVLPDLLDEPALNFSRIHSRIRPNGFLVGVQPTTIKVDTDRMIAELLNKSLYGGKPAWFRELLQNAFDACRDAQAIDPSARPAVQITCDTIHRTISFADSGLGMTRETVEGYLLVAGASYWTSFAYKTRAKKTGHVGRFGVGFMSAFAVAEHIQVATRHVESDEGIRYLIRSPKQIVRVEFAERSTSGTTVTLYLQPDTFAEHDLLELFNTYCTHPEFPVCMIINDDQIMHVIPRALGDGNIPTLHPVSGLSSEDRVTLLQRRFGEPGFEGVFSLAKIRSNTLRAYVPNYLGMIGRTGYRLDGESGVYFGGINYPPLSSAERSSLHVPSFGILQLAVSPEFYPLEMNLARDRYIAGEATSRLLRSVLVHLDKIVSEDLEEQLAQIQEPTAASTLAALYSKAMIVGWLAHVVGPSHHVGGAIVVDQSLIDDQQQVWEQTTRIMLDSLQFKCIHAGDRVVEHTLRSLISEQAPVFAAGSSGRGIDSAVKRAVFEYAPDACLILGLPHPDFGILQLRQWATEEHLVPVSEFSRTAYGLQLSPTMRSLQYLPTELTPWSVPMVSGPERWAVLDYRDLMAEAAGSPLGSPEIVAPLNRRHPSVARLVESLSSFSAEEARRHFGPEVRLFRQSLRVGYEQRYNDGAIANIVEQFNRFAGVVSAAIPHLTAADVPPYIDGRTVQPFGRFTLSDITKQALIELSDLEGARILLS